MTTQAVSATIGNPSMSRVYSATATDGQYSNLNESVTSTALGLSQPNQTISYVCATFTAGAAIWRILRSTTNEVVRQGFCSQVGFVNQKECMIQPITVQPDMLFQVYPLAIDATANQVNALGIVTSNRGQEAFIATDVVDSTATNFLSLISGLGVGDLLFGANLTRVQVQVESGGSLTSITLLDAASGTQYTGYGSVCLPTVGGQSTKTNGDFTTSLRLEKGWKLQITTVSV